MNCITNLYSEYENIYDMGICLEYVYVYRVSAYQMHIFLYRGVKICAETALQNNVHLENKVWISWGVAPVYSQK